MLGQNKLVCLFRASFHWLVDSSVSQEYAFTKMFEWIVVFLLFSSVLQCFSAPSLGALFQLAPRGFTRFTRLT